MVSICTEGIVESEKQQAKIQSWAEQIAEQKIERIFLNAIVQNINSFIRELVDERIFHMSDSTFFKEDPILMEQLAKLDENITQLGIEPEEENSFAGLVVFYLSIKAAIICVIRAEDALN